MPPKHRRGGGVSRKAAVRAAAREASLVPVRITPPMDPPTVRQNPRRELRIYADLASETANPYKPTAAGVWHVLNSSPASFNGHYFQVIDVMLWGPAGLSGGSATDSRLHLIDARSGVDVDDRGTLNSRARVGLHYPVAARPVWNKDDTSVLFQCSITGGGEPLWRGCQVLFHVIGW